MITTLSPSAYTVTLNAPVTGQIWGIGGTVSPNTPANYSSGTLTITRVLPFTQQEEISNQGNQYPIVTETALDILCMEIQQVAARTGSYRGTWVTNTYYNFGDVVQDGINGANTLNIYTCANANTSGTWATDLASGDWILAISQTSVAGGDLTGSYPSPTIAKIQGTTVTGVTGTGNAVLSASPIFTGTPTAPTAVAETNTTQIATTAFAQNTVNVYSQGFVNKFRNATINVVQRGNSATIGAGSQGYTADGWIVSAAGANVIWAVNYSGTVWNSGAANILNLTGNTGSTQTQIIQNIESIVAAPLSGQTVTISAWIYNSTGASITPQLSVNYANAQDNFSAVTTVFNGASLQSCPANSWTHVSYTYTDPGHAYLGTQVVFAFGTALNANTKNINFGAPDIRVTPGVTVGLNSNPPQSELRPIGIELPFNQRYLASSTPNGIAPNAGYSSFAPAIAVMGTAPNNTLVPVTFPVQLRGNPTITLYDTAGNSGKYSEMSPSGVISANIGVAGTVAIGLQGFYAGVSTGSPPSQYTLMCAYLASAEL